MATVVGILDRDSWSANTDNIVIANPLSKTLTWIPRDLWCPSLSDRINRVFALGGLERLLSALRELEFQCDYGLVLRRGATELALARVSVEVTVDEPLDFWYPLAPTRPLEEGQKIVSFRPPTERLEGERIHQWVGARKGVGRQTSDWHRMSCQQMFLRALLDQQFSFASIISNGSLVQMSAEDAVEELARIDSNWSMHSFKDARPKTIDGKMVLVKGKRRSSLHCADAGAPQLAVIVLALGAPVVALDAVRSVLAQKPEVELVVVNSGGGGMPQLLASHGLNVPVIEYQERLNVGAARNIGIKATSAPYVAFLAADCMATPGWVGQRIEAHQIGAAAVGSAVMNSNPRNPISWAAHLATWPRRVPGSRRGLAYGASYERRLFEQHGLFREDLPRGEDDEFHDRLPQEQKPIWNPAIHTIHRNPTRLWHMISDQYRRGGWAARAFHELYNKSVVCGFAGWRSRSRVALRAHRKVKKNIEPMRFWRDRLSRSQLLPIASAHGIGNGRGKSIVSWPGV